jgi:hypothetical protein
MLINHETKAPPHTIIFDLLRRTIVLETKLLKLKEKNKQNTVSAFGQKNYIYKNKATHRHTSHRR